MRSVLFASVLWLVGTAGCVVGDAAEGVPCVTDSDCPDLYVCGTGGTAQVCQPLAASPAPGGDTNGNLNPGGDPNGGNNQQPGPGTGGGDGNTNPNPNPGDGNPAPVDNKTYWCGAVERALNRVCSNCHGPPPNASNLTYFRTDIYENAGNVQGLQAIVARVLARVETSTMPPVGFGTQPTADERALILKWVADGGLKCATPTP